jgi:quinohemoprotein ethanol dehydrogenase
MSCANGAVSKGRCQRVGEHYCADGGPQLRLPPIIALCYELAPLGMKRDGERALDNPHATKRRGGGATASGAQTAYLGWNTRVQTHRLLTFALDGSAKLPYTPSPVVAKPIEDPSFVIDPARVQAGSKVYGQGRCGDCHGFAVIGGGYAPDLRASPVPLSVDAFRQVVKGGSLQPRGMPKYDELSDDDLESLRHFLRQRARATMTASAAPSQSGGRSDHRF